MSGIVTVTVSASLDLTYHLPDLELGKLNRASSTGRELSGKGVNVAHAAAAVGHPVSGIVAVGREDIDAVARAESGAVLHAVAMDSHTRVNVTIIDGHSRTTKVNEAAVAMSAEEWTSVLELTMVEAKRLDADWIVLSGTIPSLSGSSSMIPIDELLAGARSIGVPVAVDSSGAALDLVIRDHLDDVALLKPNTHELADAVARRLFTLGDVIDAAEQLRSRGVDIVYVSMGADGALAVSEGGIWLARATAAAVVNTAGAGDASLAGFLVGLGALDAPDVAAAVSAAASWGAHAVSQPTTLLAEPREAPDARLTASPERTIVLTEPGIPAS